MWVVILLFLIYILNRKWHSINNSDILVKTPEPKLARYNKKFSLMNKTESALFFELQNKLPHNYHIFPNMRLADIVEPIKTNEYYGYKNMARKIMPKHIDFIICDLYFKPVVAVELNGGYHNKLKQIETDNEKIEILKEAQLPLVVIKVGDDFNEAVEKIKTFLN